MLGTLGEQQNKINMYSKYLGSGDYKLGVKEAILSAQRTSEITKSEVQLSKMTSLLNTINTENQQLTKKLVQLTGENKELKKVISNQGIQKVSHTDKVNAIIQEYRSLHNKVQTEQPKPIQPSYSLMNQLHSRNSKDTGSSPFIPPSFGMTQQFKSTQTSPPKTVARPTTNSIAISTNRTPEKYQSTQSRENPEIHLSIKRQRAESLHKLTPSNSIKIKDFSYTPVGRLDSQGDASRTNAMMESNTQAPGKRRYLSLVSLKM